MRAKIAIVANRGQVSGKLETVLALLFSMPIDYRAAGTLSLQPSLASNHVDRN